MQRITLFGIVLLTAFAVVSVEAVSVSASGHEFYANKTGKTKSKQTNAQVFKTGAGTLECTTVTGSGEIDEGLSVEHRETFTYSGCSAFGSKVKVSAAHFEFNANGPVKLENEVIIEPTNEECKVRIPSQTLEKATYENKSGGKVQAEATAVGIHSKGTGGSCGSTENLEGSYSGAALGELEGGTLEWK
jgi:hypothetical protein